jgi:hypothetical protein
MEKGGAAVACPLGQVIAGINTRPRENTAGVGKVTCRHIVLIPNEPESRLGTPAHTVQNMMRSIYHLFLFARLIFLLSKTYVNIQNDFLRTFTIQFLFRCKRLSGSS